MDKATHVFNKLAETKSPREAAKIIKTRHNNPSASKVTNVKHKKKVIANVAGSNRQKIDFAALSKAIKKNQVHAYADTSRHRDGTVKNITHTLAFPSPSGKINLSGTKRSWNTKLTKGLSTKTTGAKKSDLISSHNKSIASRR